MTGGDVETRFAAMGSPCIVLADTTNVELGLEAGRIVRNEAARVESKFSRYRPSLTTRINESAGQEIELDDEASDLIDYAAECHHLSDGLFDITSGALRRAWRFDRASAVPSAGAIRDALACVGWSRVRWNRPRLQLSPGMELDFGGIGKEYAVDRAMALAQRAGPVPLLVNFGGDLCVSGPRANGDAWRVAIEDVDSSGHSAGMIELKAGALATSGDAHRHVMSGGVRYGHVLDPRTGWPIDGAPRAVTVHARSCSEAGLIAKLALLQGAKAERFLEAEGVRAWCIR